MADFVANLPGVASQWDEGPQPEAAACEVQQARASWKDSLARFPPKSNSWRTWIPTVLQAGLRGGWERPRGPARWGG